MSATNIATLKEGGTPAASQPRANILQLLGAEKTKKQMTAMAGRYMTGDRMLALCVNAIRKTPKLAQCDPQSVLGAFMAAAALGLEPNTPAGQAYLIPYDKRGKLPNGKWGVIGTECQFQIGYKGFITLAYRSPNVASLEAEAIHERDEFEHMQGSTGLVRFRKALKDRGPLVGAYCLIKMKNGNEVALTLPLDEIYKARSKSETYNSLVRAVDQADSDKDRAKAAQKLADTPWVMHEDTMASKTVIKKIINSRLPLASNDPIAIASQLDERAVDFSAMADPATISQVFEEGAEPPALEHQEVETVTTHIEADAETVSVGTVSAEVSSVRAASGAPTFDDAMSAVKSGDFDMARDIARGLPENQQRQINVSIANAKPAGTGGSDMFQAE
jgi:phage RecT family recombinase